MDYVDQQTANRLHWFHDSAGLEPLQASEATLALRWTFFPSFHGSISLEVSTRPNHAQVGLLSIAQFVRAYFRPAPESLQTLAPYDRWSSIVTPPADLIAPIREQFEHGIPAELLSPIKRPLGIDGMTVVLEILRAGDEPLRTSCSSPRPSRAPAFYKACRATIDTALAVYDDPICRRIVKQIRRYLS